MFSICTAMRRSAARSTPNRSDRCGIACRTRHKRACEVVACEARTLTTEICAYLPKLPRAKPRTSSRPQQSSAPIGRLGWQTSPSRPAVSTRPRSRLLTVAPRGSRQSATFVTRIHGCDGCGLCHSLARCASAQNERTDAKSSSILRIGCPWPR